ncbi:MAG TPA: hypothetical protein VKV17_16750 [Bryobacteraceae bacterium]|nr:hypothetical protein [Bryobacteraceae bacterium]
MHFGLHPGPAVYLSGTGTLSFGECFGIHVSAQISGGKFELALPASLQAGGQFVSGKERTFLKADIMVAEER